MTGNRIALAAVLASYPVASYADGFLPTMISANIMWLVALPLVVGIEGWLIARQAWHRPYKSALVANLLSMLAALPVGVILSFAGFYLVSSEGRQALSFVPDTFRKELAQVFLYGQVAAPSYGFLGSSNASISLSALLFMGICWSFTVAVEGLYFSKLNPAILKAAIYRRTIDVNIASYLVLMTLWIPYSYLEASRAEKSALDFCSCSSGGWSSDCPAIWEKFPETKVRRFEPCK